MCSSPHIQTVIPILFRKVPGVTYKRERIDTPDEDFIHVDWSRVGSRRLAIVTHGLEGDSGRAYMKGMVKALNRTGWDAVAMNFRGCSGEPNRKLRLYHSGETKDLHTVVSHVAALDRYDELGPGWIQPRGERDPEVPGRAGPREARDRQGRGYGLSCPAISKAVRTGWENLGIVRTYGGFSSFSTEKYRPRRSCSRTKSTIKVTNRSAS